MLGWSDFAEKQPLASKIIINSILKERLSHAYLIQGERGTGKKTFASLLAMTLFCENRDRENPCHTCHACRRIQSRNHPDVHWVEPDGATIKNEQIDYLRKEFAFSGVESTRKVYVINHADTLTTHAANRLLKFLEEPNITSTAILLTEQGQLILPTIRSRCQMLDLQPLNEGAFQEKLLQVTADGVEIKEAESKLLTSLTTNVDEAIAMHQAGQVYEIQKLVKELFHILATQYEERFLFIHDRWLPTLADKEAQALGLELLLLACRDIVHAQVGSGQSLSFFEKEDAVLQAMVEGFSNRRLVHMLKLILDAKQKWAQHVHPTLVVEQLILQF